ncbi:hypothetical protein BJ508DRAFT_415884 [Ascobolus immersus RN42]|uniref:Uncharacterized protein n=1 Tax=Ascobolus immersus RN42 TaxID=1160509 RepID=A0A3N4I0A4_ASCIM|nr:hypothetical protein BJ508DRAFT_415884 [Ascobolus immersus RN42]
MKFEGLKLLSALLLAGTASAGAIRGRTSSASSTTIPTPTTTTDPNSSPPPSCVNTPGSTARVTKTLHFDDIDGTQASRVPVPQGYNGFTFSDPADNKVYMAGSSATISSPNLLYVSKGRLGLGALGFPFNPQYFHILTFLDGIDSARLVIGGVLIQPFEQIITTDRAYVRIGFPPFDRYTAVDLTLTLYAGSSTTETLPFWLDDFVYVRRERQVTCCQLNNPSTPTILDFDDIRNKKVPAVYKGYTLAPKAELSIQQIVKTGPNKKNALKKSASANPLSISRSLPFNLLGLTVTIPQYVAPQLGSNTQTLINLTGYNVFGQEVGLNAVPAVTYTPGPFSIVLGSDWQLGNAGGVVPAPGSGLVAGGGTDGTFSSAGFRGMVRVEVFVETVRFGGPGGQVDQRIRREFTVDDVRVVNMAGCEEDF